MNHYQPERLAAGLTVLSVLFAVGFARAAEENSPPNVVVMMVDDMGWSDLGCYGSEIRTPNLDKLAANGLRFTQFYNTAKCAQTRATLLSGQYHNEVGIGQLRNCWTLAEAMKTAGYHTIMTGKWHLNRQPTDRGFDRYFGHLSGVTDFFVGDKTFRLDGEPFDVPKQGFYTTDANVDYALRFLDEARDSSKPFFCYVAFNAPHYPLQAPKEDVERYIGKYKVGWDKLRRQRFARQKELGLIDKDCELTPRPDDVPAWDTLDADTRQKEDLRMATFAAMVDRVDQNVGRLVEYLKGRGELDNTLILFLSDNGACPFNRNHHIDLMPWQARSHWTYDKGWAHACNTPWREYKRNQHEGGISSPLIVHWPAGLKTEPGALTHDVGHLVDVMATLVDLTGTEYPAEFNGQQLQPLRGKSLLPIFRGETGAGRPPLYFDFANRHHALRIGPWKLVNKDRGPWELYNIDEDRSELHDLVKKLPDRAAAMQQQWETWARAAGVIKKPKGGGKKKTQKAAN
jgi:arylsulfatase